MDRAHVTEVTGPFGRLLAAALGVLAAGLLAAAALQVSAGLRPFRALRAALAAVRAGRRGRVDGRYPQELQPLVDELNALLGQQDAVIERARTQAGNLAHGLKTPLALVANEADELARLGQEEPSERLRGAVDSMGRLVDVHLARARMAAAPNRLGLRTPVAPVAERVVRTLRRLHAERALALELDVAPGLAFAGDAEDLSELLGNLVDNGCKWGRSRVRVAAHQEGRSLRVEVADDGPGLDSEHAASALSRGGRLDEKVPGDGLGLSIVRELAELYGGAVRLERAPLGGLRAVVELPAG
jgi:signal transduction histidine kinase